MDTIRQRWSVRVAAVLMGAVLLCGISLGVPLHVLAAASQTTVLLGEGDSLDFENPPPIPEGYTPPRIGLEETLLTTDMPGENLNSPEADLIKKLLSAAYEWASTSGVDFASEALLSAIFGGKESQQMEQILANQKIIIDLIEKLTNLVKTLDYKAIIDTKTTKMNTLWDKYLNKSTAIADKSITAQQRKDKLKQYFNGEGDNYVMQVIDLYVNYIEGKGMLNGNIFSTYDAYSLYNYWWEHEGYDFRESVRVLDVAKLMQMWTLAYAACEAHVQDNSPVASEAKAAQSRLNEILKGDNTGLMGLEKLLEQWSVKRQGKNYYTFQVPGHEQRYYIPPQDEIFARANQMGDINIVRGLPTFTVLQRYCQQIPDAGNPSLLHDVANPKNVLEPLVRFYHNNGKDQTVYQILGELTGDTRWTASSAEKYWGVDKTGFMTDKPFDSSNVHFFKSIYEYSTDLEYTKPSAAWMHWIRFRTDSWLKPSSGIRETILVKPLCWYAVYKQETTPTNVSGTEIFPTESETSAVGVLAKVEEDSLFLQMDMPGEANLPLEQVLITSEIKLADGTLLDGPDLQKLLNCEVQVDGIFSYAEDMLTVQTLTVLKDALTHEVRGTIVSSVANAVMVLDENGITNGYFLPSVENDIPLGTQIFLHYHWEEGEKKVDDYELTNMSESNSAPVPEPEISPTSQR